jgi:hypothetical protein
MAVTSVCYFELKWHYNSIEAYHEVKPNKIKAAAILLANQTKADHEEKKTMAKDIPFSILRFK